MISGGCRILDGKGIDTGLSEALYRFGCQLRHRYHAGAALGQIDNEVGIGTPVPKVGRKHSEIDVAARTRSGML
ncbi:hypothetical protein CG716_28910 [Mycolicibacterium sphagni]|uniref:Uncharacterized protein n=1 Tax=Mycolicibacterium sphagni TaxID=1786 RepID=A0A255D712_9MYCO|nr:hypothetical protein CG716_28910 [Mycolicibacterium sphagni]